MKRINIFEILLAIICIGTAGVAIGFGIGFDQHSIPSSGLDGGAIALGIISATALISIVWIEIIHFKNKVK